MSLGSPSDPAVAALQKAHNLWRSVVVALSGLATSLALAAFIFASLDNAAVRGANGTLRFEWGAREWGATTVLLCGFLAAIWAGSRQRPEIRRRNTAAAGVAFAVLAVLESGRPAALLEAVVATVALLLASVPVDSLLWCGQHFEQLGKPGKPEG